jgi:hypothetical protein
MPQYEHDHGCNDIDFWVTADTEPTEELDQWQLSDFDDLLPQRF